MTRTLFYEALAAGAEQIGVWSQLLDRINVFPVADGDTGRNLVISLAPLRQQADSSSELCRRLLLAARGNSGNIAACFLREFVCMLSLKDVTATVERGRVMAYGAVSEPQSGTMLSLFDRLADFCSEIPSDMNAAWTAQLLSSLEKAVADTVQGQRVLQQAGVVDAGALGMYLFFDGFFSRFAGTDFFFSTSRACFKDNLRIADSFSRTTTSGFCIDAVVKSTQGRHIPLESYDDSAVVINSDDYIKVHLHAADREKVKLELSGCGEIISWSDDDLAAQTMLFSRPAEPAALHIMTDAAGSITREDAAALGLTLLDSYITMGDSSLPETCCVPADIYKAMREGIRCSTAQASMNERYRHYESVLGLHNNVLYLCVGSVYTGNYQAASAWKQSHDHDCRFSIVDTGTASGRLAVAVYLTVRFVKYASGAAEAEAFAHTALARCHEYIFVDTLTYLAAGGRLSKSSAFLGNMLKCKPVISPQYDGAQKVGIVRNRNEQVHFIMEKLAGVLTPAAEGLILFEYTDNRSFVEETAEAVQRCFPKAELLLRPLSLTTGVHTGPGTWAVAFASEII